LIQRFPRCDSIVAPKPPLAAFCNNIGPLQMPGSPAPASAIGSSSAADSKPG
jgi:hypothetical protein